MQRYFITKVSLRYWIATNSSDYTIASINFGPITTEFIMACYSIAGWIGLLMWHLCSTAGHAAVAKRVIAEPVDSGTIVNWVDCLDLRSWLIMFLNNSLYVGLKV